MIFFCFVSLGGNAGEYKYTKDLLQLDGCRPICDITPPSWLTEVKTPLRVHAWAAALQSHPDTEFKEYLLQGIRSGFRIGFNCRQPLKASHQNMCSAYDNPQVIEDYLGKESAMGHVVGPLPCQTLPHAHASPFGVIPKSSQPAKWRMIVNTRREQHK